MPRRTAIAVAVATLSLTVPAWADQASAVQAIRSQNRVLDAKPDNAGTLYVFVKAEKIAWAQYATYLCQVAKPHQGRVFKIRIVDVTQANFSQNPNNWPRLAESACGH